MGISGLLPLLKSIHKHTTLKKFAGQTLGIDGYGWLHRGSVACAIELALEKPTTKYIEFAINRVRMLLDFGITPYVVFDGDALPSKAGTNRERRERREEAKRQGLSLYKAGKISQAYQELQKAASVTPQMARRLIEELKRMNVQYIVAPYEADAQLAYLEQKGIIDGILSEDSDLLVFGAKRLITKLGQYGECVEIERKDFPLVKEVSLSGWTDTMFRRMAILSGCDYLPNIEKMGLKTAYRYVRKYKEPEKVIRMISFEGKLCVPQGYLDKFNNAELTFLHHRVFCPIQQKMVFLTNLDPSMKEEDLPFLGVYVEPDIAIGVACGDLNPKTKDILAIKRLPLTRPGLMENRRQTLGTPSELKSKNPIDTFFKPQRTPLQELDPNSLTPSPSQQRLLERNRSASWEPRLVSSVPQLPRVTSSLLPTPSPKSTNRQIFLSRASTISSYKPPKRQRLCSEGDLTPSKEIKQSPFFASDKRVVSPLDQRRSRARKHKPEFDVWSDDSVDDILLGITDVQQIASPAIATLSKHEEASTQVEYASASLDVIPQSPPTQPEDMSEQTSFTTNETSQTSTGACPSACVSTSDESGTRSTSTGRTQSTSAIPQSFFTQSKEVQERALEQLTSTQSSRCNATPHGALDSGPRAWHLTGTTPSTPSKSLFETFVYQSPEQQQAALHSLQRSHVAEEFVERDRQELAQARRRMVAGGEYRVRDTIRATGKPVGSEDALVPNSEDEGWESEELTSRPTINLQKFAFNP